MKYLKSHPTRGAWIETVMEKTIGGDRLGRTPHGVRGLKRV